jgi:peptidyl-prolyl cis-trans isomerase SurA
MTTLQHIAFLLAFALPVSVMAATEVLLDTIVAIVDEGVITERQLKNRIQLVKIELKRSKGNSPSNDSIQRQVLEALINDSLLLQESSRRGIKITDSQLNQTMQRIAKKNKLSLSDYRKTLLAEGIDYDKYRETVRRELIISTLQRQYSQRNAVISEVEVDDFIARNVDEESSFEYRLAHILIPIPDAATPEQVNAAQQTAAEIISELDQEALFEELANTFSAGETALQGGDLGWRKKAEIPSLFTSAILPMDPGDYAGPIRSPSGLHIVHLSDRRDLAQVLTKQTRSRHILIKPNELVSEQDSEQRLLDFRKRILDGEEFSRLARLYSVDYTSGALGGDIGWQQLGATVKEYENVASQLEIGELSQPFRSQFGWHLLEVTERRTVDETAQNKRDKIYGQLLQQKKREVFDLWKRRLRDKAYVIYPEKPDA